MGTGASGAKAARAARRVVARGTSASQAARRTKLSAAPVTRWPNVVLARPRYRVRRKPQTWTMRGSDGPVSVCGTCKSRVNRVIRAPMLFGPPSASRARILEVARGA